MKVIVKPSFEKDIDLIREKSILHLLNEKISQIEKAKTILNITGLKLLRGYSTHYRIKIETGKYKFRIGAIIRNDTVWLIRFLPRKKVYLLFP